MKRNTEEKYAVYSDYYQHGYSFKNVLQYKTFTLKDAKECRNMYKSNVVLNKSVLLEEVRIVRLSDGKVY